jgi:hypothetical protein
MSEWTLQLATASIVDSMAAAPWILVPWETEVLSLPTHSLAKAR